MSARRRPRRSPGTPTAALAVFGVLVLFGIAGGAFAGGSPGATPDPAPVESAVVSPAAPSPVAPSPTPAPEVDPAEAASGTASALLATLEVKGKAPKTGYDRTGMFGSAWIDVDRNGCDTRNDILARDLTDETTTGGCRVLTGTLLDPYTGQTILFVRGDTTSTLVQIDHVVALSNAWQTGAQQLTQDQRVSLANDPLNLLAVDGRTNSSKGDGDTATWLPPVTSSRCAYVARQVAVKAAYGLWVAPAEHDAMARVLGTCPDEPAVPTSP